jgi:hypothetical protein
LGFGSRLTEYYFPTFAKPCSLAATLFGLPAGAGWTMVSTGFVVSVGKKMTHYFNQNVCSGTSGF